MILADSVLSLWTWPSGEIPGLTYVSFLSLLLPFSAAVLAFLSHLERANTLFKISRVRAASCQFHGLCQVIKSSSMGECFLSTNFFFWPSVTVLLTQYAHNPVWEIPSEPCQGVLATTFSCLFPPFVGSALHLSSQFILWLHSSDLKERGRVIFQRSEWEFVPFCEAEAFHHLQSSRNRKHEPLLQAQMVHKKLELSCFPVYTYLAEEVPWSRRWFSQGEA